MILSIGLGMVLLWNTYLGYRRGFIVNMIHLCSYLVAGWVAFKFTHSITNFLLSSQPNVNLAVINAIVCLLLFIIVFNIIRQLGRKFSKVDKLPVINIINTLLGLGLGLIIGYLLCWGFLKLALPFDNQWLQSQYNVSSIAQFINGNFLNNVIDQSLFR